VNINDFFKNDGLTTFVDKMCAFLGIPTNRMRIVNVRPGSVYIDHMILSDNQSDTADMDTETKKLTSLANKIKEAHSSGSLDVGYPVKDISTTVMVSPASSTGTSNNSTNTNNNNTDGEARKRNITVAVVLTVVSLVLVVGLVVFFLVKG